MELVVTPDGETILAAGRLSNARAFGLTWVPDFASVETRQLRLASELAAGKTIERGSLVPLTSQQWIERWEQYTADYPIDLEFDAESRSRAD